MKHLLGFILFFVFVASLPAQIVLEHTYPPVNNPDNAIYDNVSLVEVDSGLWKYIVFNGRDSIFIYNLNHSFDHWIKLPDEIAKTWDLRIAYFSKKLFDTDDKYEYML